MKLKDLSGKEYHLDIRSVKFPMRSEASCKSKIQYQCGQIIQKRFPFDIILEEIPVPGERLFIDFFIPTRRLAFEIQGGQHEKFSQFFHGTTRGFEESKARDIRKKEWCELNNITLICVRNEKELKECLF